MTKAFKVELYVIDANDNGLCEEEIKVLLERTKHLYPSVKNIQKADIGEWSDDHPMNKSSTSLKDIRAYFSD